MVTQQGQSYQAQLTIT